MRSAIPSLLALLAATSLVGAQGTDEAPKPPKPPVGWKQVTSKDGQYSFHFPNLARTGTRERTTEKGKITMKSQVNFASLRESTLLTVAAVDLSGEGIKGLKIKDIYKMVIDMEKDEGGEVSEPTEQDFGKRKAREYTVVRNNAYRRVFVLVVPGRVYQLAIDSTELEMTLGDGATTFLKSLFLTADGKQ